MILIRNSIQRLLSASGACQSPIINSIQTRTKVRYHLAYVTEVKRVRKQGFKKFTKTETGRKQLMTRILRGDKVIAQ